MSKMVELILCGCIVLMIGGSNSMADDTRAEDKSIELLQQHLCRDECYKKVRNLSRSSETGDGDRLHFIARPRTLSIGFPIPSFCSHFPNFRLCVTCAILIHPSDDPKQMLRCSLCKWIPLMCSSAIAGRASGTALADMHAYMKW